jgi:DNA-binding PadR family transcriptional regulator
VVKQLASYPLLQSSPPDTTGVYRQIKQLEEKGSIRTVNYPDENGKIKKHYQLTPNGLECLVTWQQTLIDYRSNITMLIEDIGEVVS